MAERNRYTVPIVMMILLFGMIAFVTNLAAPLGVVIKEQFSASSFLGMLGNFANFIAYAIMGIPAGKLLERIGYKKTALAAIIVGLLGVGIQYVSGIAASFGIYLIGAFVAGFSMCMLNTVVNPMLNTLGGGGKRGNQLIQVGGTFSSLMATCVPILVGMLVGEVTKNTAISDVDPLLFIAMGTFLVIGIVLALVKIPEPHIAARNENERDTHSPWSFRHFVLGVVAIFISVGIEVGVPGTMNFFLVDYGLTATVAGTVVGTYYILMLIGRILGVSIAAKCGSKTMLAGASAGGILLILLAIVWPSTASINMPVFQTSSAGILFDMQYVPVNALFLALTGLCTSVMWGAIFNLAVEGLGKYVAPASGIFMMMVCGGGILPLLQNGLSDHIGYLPSYWIIWIGLVYLLFYALYGSKNVNKDIPVE